MTIFPEMVRLISDATGMNGLFTIAFDCQWNMSGNSAGLCIVQSNLTLMLLVANLANTK